MKKFVQLLFILACIANYFCLTASAQTTEENDYVVGSPLENIWGKSLNPTYIERIPTGGVTTDENGNVYGLFSVGASRVSGNKFQAEESLPEFAPNTTSSLIVKYNQEGKALWQVYVSGNMVKGYNIYCDTLSQTIYVAGTFDNVKPIKAYDSEGQSSLAKINTGGMSDDAFLMSIDYDGKIKNIRRIGGEQDPSGDVSSAIEVPNALTSLGENLYLGIYCANSASSVNFSGTPINQENKPCAYILQINKENLDIKDVCVLKGLNGQTDDEVLITCLTNYNNNRLFFGGNTQAPTLSYSNEQGEIQELSLRGAPNALFFGEIKTDNNKPIFAKGLPINEKNQSQVLNTIAIGGKKDNPEKEPDVYLGGSTDGIPVEGKTDLVLGAFIIKWNVSQEVPEQIYSVGGNNEDNILRNLVVDRYNKRLYASGSLTEKFDTGYQEIACTQGSEDLFYATINTQTGKVEKHTFFGASGYLEDVLGLIANEKNGKLYTVGYYNGEGFSLPNCSNVKDTFGNRCNYFITAFKADWLTTSITPINPEVEKPLAYGQNQSVILLQSGTFKVYNLNGERVAYGEGVENETIATLPQGIYIIEMNGIVQRIVL